MPTAVFTLITTISAVLGTLAGAWIASRAQHQAARITADTTRAADLRRDQLAAITALAEAISNHRRTLWQRGTLWHQDRANPDQADPGRLDQLRDQVYATRAAITAPLTALRVLIDDPAVRAAADHMITVTYAIRDATTATAVDTARADAVTAHDAFVEAAAHHLKETR
ncbi:MULTISPECIES: protein kilB [Actinomycetes]|uniref:protein kilB n=1 Tax=Actinomycetes TaxID=1760 RepID=UPI0034104602